MRNIVLGILVLVLVGGGVAAYLHQQSNTPEAKRERLAEAFISILPDSLDNQHREEIRGLFETLWYRHERGLVADADVDTIMTDMQRFVDAGRISGTELVYYMAQVGYKAYAGEERYRLPSGIVDHPVLNPEGATVDMIPDSVGIAEWQREQERKAAQARRKAAADSVRNAQTR
jgi:hypothetical protein